MNWKLLMWRPVGSWDQFQPELLEVAPYKTQNYISIYILSRKFVTQEWNQNTILSIITVIQTETLAWELQAVIDEMEEQP